jgi:C_GCAxxG_C_C family probable redox protein
METELNGQRATMDRAEDPNSQRVQELAIAIFDLGFNCAEASLMALGCASGWPLAQVSTMATGLGAGHSGWGLTCGCLTGSAMALGLLGDRRDPDDLDAKEAVYGAVDSVMTRFQERFGSAQCRTLTGLDFRDPAIRNGQHPQVNERCRAYLRAAVAMALEEYDWVFPGPRRRTAPIGSDLRLRLARSAMDYTMAHFLLQEYGASLDFSLCFQDFAGELQELSSVYYEPRGAFLLAEQGGKLAGCVALRSLEPGIGEVKRLYVRPPHRGSGLGRALAEGILVRAAELGLGVVRLDTVPSMEAAIALYRSLGFKEIPPYRHNPLPGALCFEKAM